MANLGTRLRAVTRRMSRNAQVAAWRIEGNLAALAMDGLAPTTRAIIEELVRRDVALIEAERAANG